MEFTFGPASDGGSFACRLDQTTLAGWRTYKRYDSQGIYIGTASNPRVQSYDVGTGLYTSILGASMTTIVAACGLTSTSFLLCTGTGVRVATFSGGAISMASVYATPIAFSTPVLVALSSTKFVIVGDADGYVCATVGTVSGTAITFGSVTQLFLGSVADARKLTSSKIVFAYRPNSNSLSAACVTVSGTTASCGAAYAVASSSQTISTPRLIDLDSATVIVTYRDGSTAKARPASVSGTVVTFGAVVNGPACASWGPGCSVTPRVLGLYPKRIVVAHGVSVYPNTYTHLIGMSLSSSGALSTIGSSTRVTGLYTYPYSVSAATDWRVAVAGETKIVEASIVQEPLTMTFGLPETMTASDAKSAFVSRALSDDIPFDDPLLLRSRPNFAETLELSEGTASFWLNLNRVLTERLKASGLVKSNGLVIGDDVQEWIYFFEEMDLESALSNHPLLLWPESAATSDRLRLGGVFDGPTTKILTSIIKTALHTGRL